MIGKFRVFNKKFGSYHDFEDLVIDMNGKGSKPSPGDEKKYRDNWKKIFRRRK